MEREEITKIFAANIEAAMAKQGTNPAKLARDAGLNQTGIYDIITGKSRNPRLDTIDKIAKALRVSVSYLLRERSDDELAAEILNILSCLPEDDRRRLIQAGRAWSDSN